MEKARIILTDADGVLCNWNEGFSEFMALQGHPLQPGTCHEYSIAKRHNISIPEAIDYVTEYNESENIARLTSFADSIEYVAALADLGFRFIVVTAISEHPISKKHRTMNLENMFGQVFDEIHCIKTGGSKAEILKQWAGSGYFWIEDHMRQAEAGHEVGLKTVLINHPYNTHYETDLFPRVSYETPWKEIYKLVCEDYKIEI